MDTIKAIQERLESLVSFSGGSQAIDEVMGETKTISLLLEKNLKTTNRALYERVEPDIRLALLLLSRLEHLIVRMGGAEKAVSENIKALVFATLEQLVLRIGISASLDNLFTLFTNAASFILNRVAEYAYVRSAQESQDIHINEARMNLRDDLWETAFRNIGNGPVPPGQADQIAGMISKLIALIDGPRSIAPYIQFYALLYYLYLLNGLKNLTEHVRQGA